MGFQFHLSRSYLRALWVASGVLLASFGQAQSPAPGRVALYAAVGTELTQYDVDIEGARLTRQGSVTLPGNIQYAWPHPTNRYFYVGWTGGKQPGSSPHGVNAFRIDPASGALQPLGQPAPLPSRPVHLCVDISGTHVLVAHNNPSAITVFGIKPDGTLGGETKEPSGLDTGIYAHQVRVDPSNSAVILVTRGNGPTPQKAEDPGALKIFKYKDGILSNLASVAPNRGFNFQPRHLDFHPTGPWVFVSLERQNQLQVYRKLQDGSLSPAPLFTKDSLTAPARADLEQAAGTVHVHPNGKFVYQANRAGTGGENTIAVYAVDSKTGEPARIQNIDTQGFSPRTFALDPAGRILIAANSMPVVNVPASMSVYRVQKDGKLEFVRKYDVDATSNRNLFWMGLVALPK